MKHTNNLLERPLDPNNKAEWVTLRKMHVTPYRHSTGYVLVDADLAHQPRPGAGVIYSESINSGCKALNDQGKPLDFQLFTVPVPDSLGRFNFLAKEADPPFFSMTFMASICFGVLFILSIPN